jgi:hypothetical protein
VHNPVGSHTVRPSCSLLELPTFASITPPRLAHHAVRSLKSAAASYADMTLRQRLSEVTGARSPLGISTFASSTPPRLAHNAVSPLKFAAVNHADKTPRRILLEAIDSTSASRRRTVPTANPLHPCSVCSARDCLRPPLRNGLPQLTAQ